MCPRQLPVPCKLDGVVLQQWAGRAETISADQSHSLWLQTLLLISTDELLFLKLAISRPPVDCLSDVLHPHAAAQHV
jgi:hypothetical protein